MTYTVICCDTGNYECSSNPPHTSVRTFIIDEEDSEKAGCWARKFLVDEFGDSEWRIIAVVPGEQHPFTEFGKLLAVDATSYFYRNKKKDSDR